MRSCWCGAESLLAFSQEYSLCPECGTLISQQSLADDELLVRNDDTDFYGKQYWLGHQSGDLGFPDIYKRARNDLTERNLHWLKTLLKYRLPPAKVLELGCSHGSFVALLGQAGYDTSGVEMSPWVVEFGRKTFDAEIAVGPVENLEIPLGSFDVVALMDVLEHLPDPMATMAHCLQLLKPDGLLLIQTPDFKKDMNYMALVETQDAFLEQLKADEHLYLFGKDSVTRLFQRLGAGYIQFESAIFDQYDMFFAVSRAPFQVHTSAQVDSALSTEKNGRFGLALLDLRERELDLLRRCVQMGVDLAARDEQVETLTSWLKESEADRAARLEAIETLTAHLKESEANRVAQGDQIETLTSLIRQLEVDRATQGKQIVSLLAALKGAEEDRAARGKQMESLLGDLRALFARPGFRYLTRFSSWAEVKALSEQLGVPHG